MGNEALSWDMCNAELVEEGNTACFPETYFGGLRCCENGMFCLPSQELKDGKESTDYLRYTIEYADVTPENVPVCEPSIDSDCTHSLSTRQHLSSGGNSIYTLG